MSTIYELAQRAPYTLIVGTAPTINQSLDWTARSVRIDNFSNQTVYLDDADTYVPTKTFGMIVPIVANRALASFKAPPMSPDPAPVNGQICRVTFYEDELHPSPGFTPTASLDLDGGDIQPLSHAGQPGVVGLAADSGHRHPFGTWFDPTWPEFGADPTGVLDAAPAINKVLALGAECRLPGNSTFRLATSIVPPVGGTSGLVIKGAGNTTTLAPDAGVTAIAFTGGYHYDPTIANLRIAGGASHLVFSMGGAAQVVRLICDRVRFESASATSTNFAASCIVATFRNCLWFACGFINVDVLNTVQVNNFLFEQCTFQSATATAYFRANTTTGGLVDNLKFDRCLFEGPSNANMVGTHVLGAMTQVMFDHCAWADFSGGVGACKLIQTQGGANGAPLQLTAVACTFVNGASNIFVCNAGALGIDWTFVDCQLNSAAGDPPFVFSVGGLVRNLTFIGCDFAVAQGWSTYSDEVTLVNCREANAVVSLLSTGAGAFLGGVGLETAQHAHGSATHLHGFTATHLHGIAATHTHGQQFILNNTGAASAGTAHTHPYNDASGSGAAGPYAQTTATAPGNTANAAPGSTDNATPADTGAETVQHTHKG